MDLLHAHPEEEMQYVVDFGVAEPGAPFRGENGGVEVWLAGEEVEDVDATAEVPE